MLISKLHEFLLKAFFAIAFVAAFLSVNTVEQAIAPDNARVFYNTATKTYAAPYCMHEGLYNNANLARQARGTIDKLYAEGNFAEADRIVRRHENVFMNDAAWSYATAEKGSLESLGYEADYDCKNSGAFTWEANALMVRIGLSDDPKSRWSADGDWNW